MSNHKGMKKGAVFCTLKNTGILAFLLNPGYIVFFIAVASRFTPSGICSSLG